VITRPSQGDAPALAARKRNHSPRAKLPPTPRHLHATLVTSSFVGIAWSSVHPHPRPRRLVYDIFRNGRLIATVHHHPLFNDHHVKPQRVYRYRVRARVGRIHGHKSRQLTIKTPPEVGKTTSSSPPPTILTQAMVDRMFWRAGFGPSAADRQQWTGQPVSGLVDHFLTTPYVLAPTSTPAMTTVYPSTTPVPISSIPLSEWPLSALSSEWLDRMQRVTNPFIERLNFFWSRHWAVNVITFYGGGTAWALIATTYRDRLQKYSDFASNPSASFRDLAVEMTTQDAAMSLYLTLNLNVAGHPNENYAREFMELFTLGVTDAAGNPNYSQADVEQLARAFTGYTIPWPSHTVTFDPAKADAGVKTFLGHTGAFTAPEAVDIVLSQPSHAPFIVSKLWGEFIQTPIPADALASLSATYLSSGLQLAPLLRGILSHPLIFDSLEEPNMIKPPVVYTVGVLRTLGVPIAGQQNAYMANMAQVPYEPPNVAGWPGGLAWATTGAARARFGWVVNCMGKLPAVTDVPGETAQAAYNRAHAAVGSPWLAADTAAQLLAYASQAPTATSGQRLERQYALMALMLGGPDGQVM
jgi:uncharacterized protein (DUF1800 family)